MMHAAELNLSLVVLLLLLTNLLSPVLLLLTMIAVLSFSVVLENSPYSDHDQTSAKRASLLQLLTFSALSVLCVV